MFKSLRPSANTFNTAIRSISFGTLLGGSTKMAEPTIRPYKPKNPDGPFPYSTSDTTPMDPGNDASFYGPPRFVTHIDDNAIINLKKYYDNELPRKGTILDFCSSWISHYPPEVFNAARKREEHANKRDVQAVEAQTKDGKDAGGLVVLGTGMNDAELKANPLLWRYAVQDLNEDPEVRLPGVYESGETTKLDASTCVVSIDYLTKPVDVLSSIRRQTVEGGRVHLAISNRCFPTKVVGRWLKVREQERLEMVGDYLWWSGWRDVEIVEVVNGGFMTDPLWVVRATNVAQGSGS